MAKNSTLNGARTKPAKPHKDYPLTAHPNGQWSKKIKGRPHYFGTWDQPDEALSRYLDEKDDLLAGRVPRSRRDGLEVRELVNRFLSSKLLLVKSEELSLRSWNDYDVACGRIIDCFGKHRLVEDLQTEDFEKLREVLAVGRGPTALGNQIQLTRTIFKFGFDSALVSVPVRFGPIFKRPSRKVRRRIRNAQGPKAFSAEEIRSLLDIAGTPVKAMILLAINAGLGNNDIGSLTLKHIDLDSGWHTFPRPKTEILRRCPLWPETIEALREAIAKRKESKLEKDANLVFITKYGNQYVRLKEGGKCWIDNVAKEFSKLLKELEIKRPGVGFYSLRRTFRTIADEANDDPAATFIMGHATDNGSDSDMSAVYRQFIKDDRLVAVCNYVHDWLFAESDEDTKEEVEISQAE